MLDPQTTRSLLTRIMDGGEWRMEIDRAALTEFFSSALGTDLTPLQLHTHLASVCPPSHPIIDGQHWVFPHESIMRRHWRAQEIEAESRQQRADERAARSAGRLPPLRRTILETLRRLPRTVPAARLWDALREALRRPHLTPNELGVYVRTVLPEGWPRRFRSGPHSTRVWSYEFPRPLPTWAQAQEIRRRRRQDRLQRRLSGGATTRTSQ